MPGVVADHVKSVEAEKQMEQAFARAELENHFLNRSIERQGGYHENDYHQDLDEKISRRAWREAAGELKQFERNHPDVNSVQLLEKYKQQAEQQEREYLNRPFTEGEREPFEKYVAAAYGRQEDQEVKESLSRLSPAELRLEYEAAQEHQAERSKKRRRSG